MSEQSTSKAVEWIVLIILLIIGVSLIPTVVSLVSEGHYAAVNVTKVVNPATANTTTVTLTIRNGSASYFQIVLNATNTAGRTLQTYITDFKDTSDVVITFYALNHSASSGYNSPYSAQIRYESSEAWSFTGYSAASTLLDLLPFIFIVGLIIYFLVRLLRN